MSFLLLLLLLLLLLFLPSFFFFFFLFITEGEGVCEYPFWCVDGYVRFPPPPQLFCLLDYLSMSAFAYRCVGCRCVGRIKAILPQVELIGHMCVCARARARTHALARALKNKGWRRLVDEQLNG